MTHRIATFDGQTFSPLTSYPTRLSAKLAAHAMARKSPELQVDVFEGSQRVYTLGTRDGIVVVVTNAW